MWRSTIQLQVVDSRPAQSAGRVKKMIQNPYVLCVLQWIYNIIFKFLKNHTVLPADEFTSSKNTHNANLAKISLKQASKS